MKLAYATTVVSNSTMKVGEVCVLFIIERAHRVPVILFSPWITCRRSSGSVSWISFYCSFLQLKNTRWMLTELVLSRPSVRWCLRFRKTVDSLNGTVMGHVPGARSEISCWMSCLMKTMMKMEVWTWSPKKQRIVVKPQAIDSRCINNLTWH